MAASVLAYQSRYLAVYSGAEIATDPNGGTTVGILAAVLYTDSKNQITDIFAPDVETNTTLGPGGTLCFLVLSIGRHQLVSYRRRAGEDRAERRSRLPDRPHPQEWWSVRRALYCEKDPTESFLGRQRHPARQRRRLHHRSALRPGHSGLNFTEDLQLALSLRPRRVRIDKGALHDVPSIFQLFPTSEGDQRRQRGTRVRRCFI